MNSFQSQAQTQIPYLADGGRTGRCFLIPASTRTRTSDSRLRSQETAIARRNTPSRGFPLRPSEPRWPRAFGQVGWGTVTAAMSCRLAAPGLLLPTLQEPPSSSVSRPRVCQGPRPLEPQRGAESTLLFAVTRGELVTPSFPSSDEWEWGETALPPDQNELCNAAGLLSGPRRPSRPAGAEVEPGVARWLGVCQIGARTS